MQEVALRRMRVAHDTPGFFLDRQDAAHRVVQAIGA
jgi:hypothetical protein